MAVDLINDHVLLPEFVNWRAPIAWERQWQNNIASAVTGHETRQGLRAQPRVSISFTVTSTSTPNSSRFDDRVRAALKTGKACVPYSGRGYVLQADVDADTAALDRPWKDALGAYVFFRTDAGAYEVRTVIDAVGNDITLDQAVARTYRANTFCWPLIFGKPVVSGGMAARSPKVGGLVLQVQELISPASVQLGAVVPPAGDGIGVWDVGTAFIIS
jgi:hypothetical protein